MKTGDLVKHFGVSESTIRRWVKEFESVLDPQRGKHRNFTQNDFLVMATVKKLADDGLTFRAILRQLEEGYRVEDTASETMGYSDGRMVPAAAVEQIIDASEIRVELEVIRAERDRLLDLANRLESKNEEMSTRIVELERELGNLQRELGRAETEARMLREQQDKKRGWFGRR